MDIKEHFGCQQTEIFSMYGFSTLTKAFQQVFVCFGCLMDIKEHFGCQQTEIFSMYGFSTLTKAFQDPSTLFRQV